MQILKIFTAVKIYRIVYKLYKNSMTVSKKLSKEIPKIFISNCPSILSALLILHSPDDMIIVRFFFFWVRAQSINHFLKTGGLFWAHKLKANEVNTLQQDHSELLKPIQEFENSIIIDTCSWCRYLEISVPSFWSLFTFIQQSFGALVKCFSEEDKKGEESIIAINSASDKSMNDCLCFSFERNGSTLGILFIPFLKNPRYEA